MADCSLAHLHEHYKLEPLSKLDNVHAIVTQGNIEKLSVKQLESYEAGVWLLAPPCQPYTRRGLQKDADDWRASSFMTLLLKLPQMQARHD